MQPVPESVAQLEARVAAFRMLAAGRIVCCTGIRNEEKVPTHAQVLCLALAECDRTPYSCNGRAISPRFHQLCYKPDC